MAARQQGILTRRDLLGLGFSREAIAHRIASGRLHPVGRGIYAVGWPQMTRERRGMAQPLTKAWINGYEVDFFWPDLDLVVETDGLRYHRTPSEQTHDHQRDQIHVASGLTTLRFTHWQVKYEPAYVRRILQRTAQHLVAT